MSTSSDRDAVARALEPVVVDSGFDLEDVVITPAGKRRLLRVIIDSDSGVGLDDIATVSRTVSDTLDASTAMGKAPYTLEVTSPGVDRPLTQARHWRRAGGRLVKVGVAGTGELVGRVTAVVDDGVQLDVDGTKHQVTWADLGPGRVQIEFSRKTGGG